MANYVIKFKFSSAVHFGTIDQMPDLQNTDFLMQSDSIFSALCVQANKLYGQAGVDKLMQMCNNDFALSSMMPFYQDTYFLPKPLVVYERNLNSAKNCEISNYGKLLKKLKYIEASNFDTYMQKVKNGDVLPIEEMVQKTQHFGDYEIVQKVQVTRSNGDSKPFHLGIFRFNEHAGTYIIVKTNNTDTINFIGMLFNALKFDGLGGRRSNGYGKFDYQIIELDKTVNKDLQSLNILLEKNSDRYMTLALSLPFNLDEEMLADAFYAVIRRGGFVDSPNYNSNFVKKRDVYAFAVGSTFTDKIEGQIVDVSTKIGSHSVFKFLKPLYVGV
ncbi:MAG: type III-A CRISPR-associated RAMP protein Csm4 [Clostridia bacterium]|nr:type III-A CRISPR-associated RAMP protein Csm4 [Clostridia bacterium]